MQYLKNIYNSLKKKNPKPKQKSYNEIDKIPIKENQIETTKDNVIENENDIQIEINQFKAPVFNFIFNYVKSPNLKEKLIILDSKLKQYSYYIFINIIFFYLNILGLYSYIESLRGCEGTQVECLEMNMIDFFSSLIVYLVYSIFIVGITIFLCIWRYLSLIHIPFLFYKYFVLFQKDHFSELDKHGEYNIIIFLVGVFILVFLLNSFVIFKKGFLKGIHFSLYFIVILFYFFFNLIYKKLNNRANCYKWDINLNNTNINHNKNETDCIIKVPKKCPMNAYFGLMDFNRFIKFDCKNFDFQDAHNLLLTYLNENYDFSKTTKFGYPNSNNYNIPNIKNNKHLNEIILNGIIDMNNKTILDNLTFEQIPEITLEFWDNFKKGKINIDLKFNEKLSKERKLKENKDSVYKNVLFIFIDSVSRVHFQRALKKTSLFCQKYIKNNFNKYSSYQYNKFHGVGHFTHPNVQPMFYGTYYREKEGQSILKYYKENGYITCHAGEICSKELYNVQKKTNIRYENYDHENTALYCDPNNFDRANPYPINKGQQSVLRRCLYKKENHEYLFEYSKQFWEKYKNNRKFLRMAFTEGHEMTGEVIKYIDEPLYNFLNYFMDNGYLKETALFLITDHGLHYGIYFNAKAEDAIIERFLPSLIILLYDASKNDKINLKETIVNQDKLICAFDIYNTLYYIAKGKNDEKEQSPNGNYLFDYIESKYKRCEKFDKKYYIDCQCV